MLSGSKIEGETQNISPGLRMTIETLKEVAKGHSEADIYATLKESNMDPNETFQKLYHQDTFHEVRRRRDRRKEAVSAPKAQIQSTGRKFQEDRRELQSATVNLKPNPYLQRNIRRGPYRRNAFSGTGVYRKFRVVRDHRMNQDTVKDNLGPAQEAARTESTMPTSLSSSKGSSNNKASGGEDPHASKALTSSHPLSSMDANNLQMGGAVKQNVSKPHSASSSNNSVLGVYFSSTDPVHVPSHGSKSVGVVGARRQSTESSANNKPSSSQGGLPSNSHFQRPPSRGNPSGRPFSSYQHNPRPNQSMAHQKSAQPNKEWKPKLTQKLNGDALEPNEKPGKSASPANTRPNNLEEETSKLQEMVSKVNLSENVVIAPHLRIPESEKHCFTFGSLGADFIPSKTSAQEHVVEPPESLPTVVSDHLIEEPEKLVLGDDAPPKSGSSPQTEKKESSAPSDVGLVSELPTFSAYDPQTGYDLTYFRPNVADEALRGHGFLSSQEILPSSSIGMVQQAQQMYPQVHLPHFTSVMPYRQFISPVYAPPIALQGYSGNPTFPPHPSNGSSYVLMPGASTKYGLPQFKTVPTGGQTGFGGFTSPTGYAMNAPGVIGNATGLLDDSARLKFKDSNLYVPNPQAETSEIWMNARELVPNIQTPSYFNMPAGQPPHAGAAAAYMASPHSGHPSFNAAAAVAQSSHTQFPMYHHHQPPQAALMGNPHHHMSGGNVAAASPGGASYQQPQIGHLNWTTGNF